MELSAVVISTISMIIAGTWQLGKVRDDIQEEIFKQRKELDKDIDTLRKNVGESISAMREKIIQVELYIRDNYERKGTYDVISQRILAEIRALTDAFDARMTRVETEIKNYLLAPRPPTKMTDV